MTDRSDAIVELAKRRGFFFPTGEAYGGVAGFYTYGPYGTRLKRRVEEAWRQQFSIEAGHHEIEAPTVLPEAVFEASGHLDTFDDMIIECPTCQSTHRADHLVEGAADIEDAEALETGAVEELFVDHELTCPTCGTSLAGESVDEFNLMFGTNIGPGSSAPGYLRPETAQAIFIEFPQLKEYARGQLPFGVTQIGRAYRNEISPRKSIIRVREFTQAELELFVDPEENEPALETVADERLPLYPIGAQRGDGSITEVTVSEAIEAGHIESPWIAYYLGRSKRWYESIGVDMEQFRFRQHLPGERAHYATDCWDAEAYVTGDWIELSGVSTRTDYDLRKHSEYSDEEFTLFRQYEEPRTVTTARVDPDMSVLGPEYGETAADIAAALETLVENRPEAFTDTDQVTVTVDGEEYTVPVEHTGYTVEEVTEAGEHIYPNVIEPSFGVDRIVYTLLEHAYREDTIDGETRTYLALPPEVAPQTAAVFPLVADSALVDVARDLTRQLREAGIPVAYDDSGAIGRRYRRQDEIGTPFCVTVDRETLETETVTLRDRDSTRQVRVETATLSETIRKLRAGTTTFTELPESPADGR